jgi:hypothetical protein
MACRIRHSVAGLTASCDRFRRQVLRRQPFGRPIEPRLDDQFLEVLDGDLLQPHQHCPVAIEMRRGEVHIRLLDEKRLLHPFVSDPSIQNRAVGSRGAKSSEELPGWPPIPAADRCS